MTTVYGIRDKKTMRIVYVGSSVYSEGVRLDMHMSQARYGSNYPIHVWLRRKSSKPEAIVLERKNFRLNARSLECEKKWVRRLIRMGEPLKNCTYLPKNHKKRSSRTTLQKQ